MGLNSSPYCTQHMFEVICNISYILLKCPSLAVERGNLFSSLRGIGIAGDVF